MAAAAEVSAKDEAAARAPGRRWRLLLALPLLLLAGGGGLWLMKAVPGLADREPAAPMRPQPVFHDLPEILANLNVPGRRPSYVRLRAKLELSRPEDAVAVQAAMPRLVDLFQTYLREMRPEELRGSAGTHRLREELIARASLAAAPARVADVLFVELLVQ
jgi:flagellar FliL protein